MSWSGHDATTTRTVGVYPCTRMMRRMGSLGVPFPSAALAAMSTLELLANLESCREGSDIVRPSPRMLARMEVEWLERPLEDRIAAERSFRG